MRTALAIVVGTLVLVGVGSSALYFTREPYNPELLSFPRITAAHVILGALYMALAPLQFIGTIRARAIAYHRWAGRALVTTGVCVGATALFLSLVIPFSGWSERVIVGGFAAAFVFALVKSLVHIRRREVSLHREWMIRAFAIGLGIASMRIIFLPALAIVGEPTQQQAALLSILSFTIAFVVHSSVAEVWIRSGRSAAQRE